MRERERERERDTEVITASIVTCRGRYSIACCVVAIASADAAAGIVIKIPVY